MPSTGTTATEKAEKTITSPADNPKLGSIIWDVIIVQGYESVKKGNISFANAVPNAGAITVYHLLMEDWFKERVPKWFGYDPVKDKAYVEWISNTAGLAGGFMISDKLLGEADGIKTSVMKSALISTVKLIVDSMAPPKPA